MEDERNVVVATKEKVKGMKNVEEECMECGEMVYHGGGYEDVDIDGFICRECLLDNFDEEELEEQEFRVMDKTVEEVNKITDEDYTKEELLDEMKSDIKFALKVKKIERKGVAG